MSSFDLLQLQNNLRHIGIMISFSGQFSQGIIEELSEAIKKHLEKENLPKGDIFNVISVFIEQAQNIRNYTSNSGYITGSANFDKIASSGIVTIGRDNEGFFIYSGNLVEQDHVDRLSEYLDHLQTLDKDSLKQLYKMTLKQDRTANQKSAGLGLIDIFRKATTPITYAFCDYDNSLKFYSIKVTL